MRIACFNDVRPLTARRRGPPTTFLDAFLRVGLAHDSQTFAFLPYSPKGFQRRSVIFWVECPFKFASLVLQVHKDWILARSTTEQAWSAVRLPQIRTPQRACRAHKAFYLSSQVEPSDSALWVKGTTRKQPVTVKLQVGRPITVHFSQRQPIGISLGLFLSRPFEPQPTGRIDFGFRRSKRRRTRSLVWSTFRSNFFKRFSSTDSFVILLSHGIKK